MESGLLARVPGLIHGFTTRAAGDFATDEAPRGLLAETGETQLRLLRQVHGVRVARVERSTLRPAADAWAGVPVPGVLLGILTADCLPVLLCHPPTRTLALAHAGWRGATAGVALAALKAMDVPAEEVKAALGPAIGPCCYQVGEDVAAAAARGSSRLAPWPNAPGRHRLDLPGLVRDDLVAAGLQPQAVEVLPLCTACRADLFYSYRRDGVTGRLCAFLGWATGASGGEGGR